MPNTEINLPSDILKRIEKEVNEFTQSIPESITQTKSDFKRMALFGYELAYLEILESKGMIVRDKDISDPICRCGHLHSEHHPISSHNYSSGRCTVSECRCQHHLMPLILPPKIN